MRDDGFVSHSTASNTRFPFSFALPAPQPPAAEEPAQADTGRQWNPEDRESQATDGLRADPSALVPKGSTVFITLDSRQARAPLRVETPALA